jgi:hypothetical protein
MSLAFLLTAVAKRDPVGRKPKRKVFAEEGLRGVERELRREASRECLFVCFVLFLFGHRRQLEVDDPSEMHLGRSCLFRWLSSLHRAWCVRRE